MAIQLAEADIAKLRPIVNVDFSKNESNVGKVLGFREERLLPDKPSKVDQAELKNTLKKLSAAVGIAKNTKKPSIMLPYAWHDGELVPSAEARISRASQGFMYGSSIFEGIRAFYDKDSKKTHIVGLKEHLERMQRGAKHSNMHLSSLEKMTKAIEAMVKANNYEGDTYIRPFVYTNAEQLGPMFITNNVKNKEGENIRSNESYTFGAIQMPLGSYVPLDGIKVLISPHKKIHSDSVPAKVKYGGMYVFCSLAKGHAKEKGYDEAIVFNKDGTLAEGSSANAFMLKGDTLITPPVSANILEGITRNKVIELAKALGYKVDVRDIHKDELKDADEFFLTGTATVVAPVTHIGEEAKEDIVIGTGKPGAVAKKLQDAYNGMAKGLIKSAA